jgi:REP element-mobilizing transposase RayT
MARLARLVIPGPPHHVTQRGNGGARTFFDDDALYRDLFAASCRAAQVEVWAGCLMPNHVHLILVPSDADGLRRRWRRFTVDMRASFTRGAAVPVTFDRGVLRQHEYRSWWEK